MFNAANGVLLCGESLELFYTFYSKGQLHFVGKDRLQCPSAFHSHQSNLAYHIAHVQDIYGQGHASLPSQNEKAQLLLLTMKSSKQRGTGNK